MSYLEGKTLVVTGAAGGFGLLVSERAIARGATVVMADVRDEALAAAAEPLGDAALAVTTDVADLGAMKALAGAALSRFGKIDVWINNAGI
ncbi:MAG: SDR family NAD(P)-dependent oxidoreductase, partial [Pseudomonadota bacterium]